MRSLFPQAEPIRDTHQFAPLLIAVGLAILLAQTAIPALPVATAIALIALGASLITLRRSTNRTAIAAHFFIYASIYLLLVGAIYDQAFRSSAKGLTLPQSIDLAISVCLIISVARICRLGAGPQQHC